MKIISVYFFGNAKTNTRDIINKIKLKSQKSDNFMSVLDAFFLEGEDRGILIGEARGLEKGKAEGKAEAVRHVVEKAIAHGKLTIEEIADYNGVTIEQVQAIRKEMFEA